MRSLARSIFLLALAAVAWPSAALACRTEIPTGLMAFPQVTVVTVVTAERTPETRFHVWRIKAKPKSAITGEARADVEFSGVLGSNGCPNPPPKEGDSWVLYFSSATSQVPDQAYPLVYVQPYDDRLSALVSSPRTAVELWATGDDGLSLKVAEYIRGGFRRSDRFMLIEGEGGTGAMKVVIPTNVDRRVEGGRTRVTYQLEIERAGHRIVLPSGSCWETELVDCGTQAARTVAAALD